jgi:ferredoxin
MTTEYEVRLDREQCDGIFACLVRDERFVEAADGLASIGDRDGQDPGGADTVTATFADDRLDEAEQAAAACPVDAIDVTELAVAEGADE